MNISPNEAEESLAAIQQVVQKTRRSIADSGYSTMLIITGIVWLIGYLGTQFLTGPIVVAIWVSVSLLGGALATILGIRRGKRLRNPATSITTRRIGLFWLLLALFCAALIAVAWPMDGKTLTIFIILFILLGQMAMGLIFSFRTVWWVLPISALALVGYFFVPAYFYLWMALLGGGTMIALGLYIQSRW